MNNTDQAPTAAKPSQATIQIRLGSGKMAEAFAFRRFTYKGEEWVVTSWPGDTAPPYRVTHAETGSALMGTSSISEEGSIEAAKNLLDQTATETIALRIQHLREDARLIAEAQAAEKAAKAETYDVGAL